MKKSVALLITLCMVLSLIPLGMVSADGTINVTADPASGTEKYSTEFTSVKLTFDSAITLAEGAALTDVITMASADGDAVEITAITENNTDVDVTFGALEEGAYILTVSKDVTGAEADTTFTYTVKQLLFELEIKGTDKKPLVDGSAIDATNVDATAATKANLSSALSLESINAGNTQKPVYHKEGDIEYLTFADADALTDTSTDSQTLINYTHGNRRIVVPMAHSLNIANKDTLTFELWVRPDRSPKVTADTVADKADSDYGRLFSFGSARGIESVTETQTNIFEFNWMNRNSGDGGPRFDNDNKNSDTNDRNSFYSVTEPGTASSQANPLGYMEEFEETWMHIVLTREWTDVDATAGTGTWTNKLYINGIKRGEKTGATSTRSTITTGTSGNPMNHLVIGGYTNTKYAFRGDVSAFKMYDGLLADETIKENYKAKRNTYFPANGRKVFGMQINDTTTGTDLVTATDDSTNSAKMVPTAMDMANTVAPTYMTEGDIEFLRFASLDATTGNLLNPTAQVTLQLSDFEIADETEVTIEAWVRPDYTVNTDANSSLASSGRMSLFSVGRHPKWQPASGATGMNVKDAYRVQFETGAFADTTASYGTMVFSNKTDRAEKATLADLSAHDGQWHHYVITRTWRENNPNETYPTRGIWSHKLYVDGVLTAEASVNSNERYDYSEEAYNNNRTFFKSSDYLVIGGSAGGPANPAFHGDIAEFSLYAGELSADVIRSKYLNSPSALTGLKDFSFVDGSGAILTDETISGAAQIGVIGSVEVTEDVTEPFVMLAVYTGESGDVLHSCIKLDATVTDGVLTVSDDAITGLTDKNITYAKLFVWEGTGSIRPLVNAYCL